MAIETQCQTPGCEYATSISFDGIDISIYFPHYIDLTDEQAELLEANIHNMLEIVLAPYFKE